MEPIILRKLPSSRSLSSSRFRTAFHCWKSKLREKRRVSMLVNRWGAWTLAMMTLGSLSILEARRVMGGSQNRHFLIPLSGWFYLLKPIEKKLQFDLRGISTKGAVILLLGTFYRNCMPLYYLHDILILLKSFMLQSSHLLRVHSYGSYLE